MDSQTWDLEQLHCSAACGMHILRDSVGKCSAVWNGGSRLFAIVLVFGVREVGALLEVETRTLRSFMGRFQSA